MKNFLINVFIFLLIILLVRACVATHNERSIQEETLETTTSNKKQGMAKHTEITNEKELNSEDKWHEITGEDIDH